MTLSRGPAGFRYVPDEDHGRPECAHPARCVGLVTPAGEQAGWLTFRIPDVRLGRVVLCCGRKRCGELLRDSGAEFLLDGQPPLGAPEPVPDGKCLVVQESFPDGPSDTPRTVHLGVRLPPRSEPLPVITHVIGH